MKHCRQFGFVIIAASLMLAACVTAPKTEALATSASIRPSATSTHTATRPVPTTTATTIPCNAFAVDYSILNGFFIFQSPISAPGIDRVDRGYPYGSTQAGNRIPHHGVEFYNGSSTPVRAVADGIVYFAGDDTSRYFSPWSGFYGNIIILKHTLANAPFDTLYTLYAHLSKIDVQNGQSVNSGEKIGEVGLTGTASGSHLHFEVRVDPNKYDSTLNPELWLVPHPGNGTMALLATHTSGLTFFPVFNIQYYPDRSKPAIAAFQLDSYAKETVNPQDPCREIAALGDQPAGWYRITFIWAGILYERWAEIQPGKLTWVMFVV
jgi:murein DD-endopeptidase MepM/ murein hydrolase activator NlpD